jgi:hypothetical protein
MFNTESLKENALSLICGIFDATAAEIGGACTYATVAFRIYDCYIAEHLSKDVSLHLAATVTCSIGQLFRNRNNLTDEEQ